MIFGLIRLIFRVTAIAFWTFVVCIGEVILIFKYRTAYFKSPKTVDYPDCVKDKKYGKSKFVDIQTTKGSGSEKTTLKMHYVRNGDKNRSTMLFLHGFPEFWYSWRYQLVEFTKTHRVLALDMRGYGLTEKPTSVKDYQMHHLINDVKGFLDALDIRSVILVAHDWGGVVGWQFEKAYPEMVEKYIALNIPESHAFRSVLSNSWTQFLKSWYMFFFQCPYLPEWKLSRFDMKGIEIAFTSKEKGLQKLKLSPDDVNAYKANMAQKGALTAGINYYRASFPLTGGTSPDDKCDHKRNETNRYMLIFGDADKFISTECAKKTKTFVPNIDLRLLPGLSHWVQQDDPVLVNRLIGEFIETK